MQPVRWGILSTARIGRTKVVPGMMKSPLCDIRAVASRDLATAQNMASEFGIAKAYGSYEALLADDEIEAIYNPLPNHLHVPLTLEAARAGKHVLCEKPIAITAREAEQLREVSDQVLIAEAFMVRHHPQWQSSRDLVQAGEIGEPRIIQVLFSYFNADPANIRNRPDIGGGGLSDIGCYAVVAGRYFFKFGSSSRDCAHGPRSGLRGRSSHQRVGRFWRWSTADIHSFNPSGTVPATTEFLVQKGASRSRSHSIPRPTNRSAFTSMTEALPEANRREWWKFQRWISTDCRVKPLVGRSDRRQLLPMASKMLSSTCAPWMHCGDRRKQPHGREFR